MEVQPQSPKRDRINRELDVKVIYDYPKGNFRFPLIPDEKKPLERKPRFTETVKDTKARQQRNEEPAKQERPQKKVRPFTPTDVPSPIYGFSKPAKKEYKEDVEYELSGFISGEDEVFGKTPIKKVEPDQAARLLPDSLSVREVPRDIEPELPTEVQHGTEIPWAPEPPQGEEVLAGTEIPRATEGTEDSVGPMEADVHYIQHGKSALDEGLTEPVGDGQHHAIENGQTVNQKDKEFILEDDTRLSFDKKEQSTLPTYEQRLEEEDALRKLLNQGRDEFANTIQEEPIAVSKAAQDSLHAFTAAGKGIDSRPEASTEPETLSEPRAGVPSSQAVPESNVEPQVEEKPSSGRSHLPFNVLMLKQDKRKYQENKIGKSQPVQSFSLADTKQAGGESEVGNPGVSDGYSFPGLNLLNPPVKAEGDPCWLDERKKMLDETLFNFNVGAKVVNVTQGPSVTRFEVHPEPGVKVNKVTNLADDIKLSLAARDIRIEAPIPGKHTIGIEVPNPKSRPVLISEIIGSGTFRENASPLTAVLGLDISGNPIVTDLKKMPHGLIAGATGSGKSVCINSILVSLLYKASPDDLKLLLIDPKMVELAPYNRIPHLVSPVITDVKAATASLKWAVEEMERRYELFAHAGVRDINRFNELAMEAKRYSEKLPFIVIIIDELADLMMMSPADVEEAICRIAQKARACGIHLIIATQRPSVDVITGLIKANVPTRIAFSVSSQIDSRTIIDIGGAERLLGRGDMLFLENGSSKPVRLQGTFVSDAEIDKVVSFAREQRSPDYLFEQDELLKKAQVTEEEDELFYEACEFVVEQGGASTSSLQRRFKVGYNRAARLIDMMEEAGFISGARGSKPRDVLITEADLESMQEAGPVHY
ncbi:DNA translocase FtsK [Neobacillus piezotolerans]|nr:DNA translocase FtsK [Neobacillus piezotolerans]